MVESMREARIFPGAISHNVSSLHRAAGSELSMMVVKADGYGHGAMNAAQAGLDGGATWLGTADITEALALRNGGITAPILAWLVGPSSPVDQAIAAGIDIGVSDQEQLADVVAAATKTSPATVHLKVDSGMGRGGAVSNQWGQFFEAAAAAQSAGLVLVRGLFTHFAQTNAASDRTQGDAFRQAVDAAAAAGLAPEILHTSSSTPAVRTPELGQSMVRLGMAAYGVAMVAEHQGVGLRPAMRVAGQVIQTKRLPAGHGVGYDHTYRTSADTTVAIVPLGYADGLPRAASSTGPVTIGDDRFVIAGRVSMDQVTIDVGDSSVSRGDWAVFFGDPSAGEPSVWEWAESVSTIPYEIVTGIGARVRRVVA